MAEIKLKISPQGITFPLDLVPALYEALTLGRPNLDEKPCHACDVVIVKGLLCGECSVEQTITEAFDAITKAMEATEERAGGKATELLSDAHKAWQES